MATYKGAKWFTERYGTSASTLRSWANQGWVDHIRTRGGKRLYNVDQLIERMGGSSGSPNATSKQSIIYARVSSSKQRGDLERQISELKEAYPNHVVIRDIGSGINFKKPGLRSLLDRVDKGIVEEIVVMYKDRLARFAIDLLEYIFSQKGVRFVVHRRGPGAEGAQQLAEDLMAITTVFVASNNGKRTAEGRRRRKRKREEEEKNRKKHDEEGVPSSSHQES